MEPDITRIFTRDDFLELSNFISGRTGAKMNAFDLQTLAEIVRHFDPEALPATKIDRFNVFYKRFVERNLPGRQPFNILTKELEKVYGFNGRDLKKSYQDREILRIDKENPISMTAGMNREGRVPLWTTTTPYEITDELPKKTELEMVNDTLERICNYFMPTSIDKAPRNTLNTWQSYNGVNITSRKFSLDSRFRDFDPNLMKIFRWNINIAKEIGATGTIRSLDTVYVKRVKGFQINIPFAVESELITKDLKISILEFSYNGYSSDLFSNNIQLSRSFNLSYYVTGTTGIAPDQRLTAIPNPAEYILELPMPSLLAFEMQLLQPDGNLSMTTDYLSAVTTPGFPTLFTTPVPNNLNSGDIVYITNFSDNTLTTDIVNRITGWPVIVITPTSFTIGLATTVSSGANIYIQKYRFILELELQCLS